MKESININIEIRKPIWVALSYFYLDTELEDSDFRRIAFKIIDSPFSLDEVKMINKNEVFPVLYPNLLTTAGEWSGFNEEWLIKNVKDSLFRRNTIKQLWNELLYLSFKWICKDNWNKLATVYNQIK